MQFNGVQGFGCLKALKRAQVILLAIRINGQPHGYFPRDKPRARSSLREWRSHAAGQVDRSAHRILLRRCRTVAPHEILSIVYVVPSKVLTYSVLPSEPSGSSHSPSPGSDVLIALAMAALTVMLYRKPRSHTP